MNKKGQTLISFVMLIPLLLIFIAFIIDTSYCYKEKNRLDNVTETILKNNYENKNNNTIVADIKNLYKKNNISSKNVEVIIKDNRMQIKNEYEIDSIFGKMIGIKSYKIKTDINSYKDGNKLVLEKE